MRTLRTGILFMLAFQPLFGLAQNLAPNPGFEEHTSLPSDYAQWYLCKDWNNVNLDQAGPPAGSPDYFHTEGSTGTFFGQIKPNNGNGQMGFATYHDGMENFREYVSAKLKEPMHKGFTYQVSFFITNGENGGYAGASNNIGIHFSNSPLIQDVANPIAAEPQIEIKEKVYSSGWVQYTFSFTPDDAYEYITIGNFRDDLNTDNSGAAAYYFIDDVLVMLINL
jgi:hypothetical protein